MDDYLYVFILMKKFLFSVNLYVFIPMMLFLWLKNCYKFSKWVYREMIKSFLLGIIRGCPKALQNTLLTSFPICKRIFNK